MVYMYFLPFFFYKGDTFVTSCLFFYKPSSSEKESAIKVRL